MALQQTSRYFATVARGLEALAATELEQLGAQSVQPGFCGVGFSGDQALLYRVNLWARIPFRVLAQVGKFSCETPDDLYQGIQALDWQPYVTPAQTLAVKATGKTSHLNHTHFTALQVKNAIVQQQQDRWGERSDIDTQSPDVLVNVHLERDGGDGRGMHRALVSLDSSGSSLHRRGYRPAVGLAPLKESLAAALIYLTGWQGDIPFLDPLCGSGTLPIEAGLMGLNIAPGLFRSSFGFQTWPDFNRPLWEELVQSARAEQRSQLAAPILGSDRDPDLVHQARSNAHRSGVNRHIQFQTVDLAQLEAPADQGILLCNPPYGARLGADQDLATLYQELGQVLKQRFKGWTAFVLSGNKSLARHIGLKSSQRIPIDNGSIPCQLMKYELY